MADISKDKEFNINVSELSGGLFLDSNPIEQPKQTLRFALNTVEDTNIGDNNFKINESSNIDISSFDENYHQIGKCYMYDNANYIALVNPDTADCSIGIFKNDKYTELINSKKLKLSIKHQLDVQFRIRKGNQRIVYFVDNNGDAKLINLDRLNEHYNIQYKNYLAAGGNPDSYVGDKWDENSFRLFKSFTEYPVFSNVEILEFGNILPGSYNFAIQYLDNDLNPTNWISTSGTVNIFNDSLSNSYDQIRGSKNVQNDIQFFTRATKSIRLTISNLDINFPFYRIAVINANTGSGVANKALVSSPISTTTSTYIYSGDDANMTETPIPDILIDKTNILAPSSIEQLENRLILVGGKEKQINFCEFQKYASEISTDVVLKSVILNSTLSEANSKNAKSSFFFTGYMPGQPVSLGIVYLLDDYTVSPVFHIAGKNAINITSKMEYYEIQDKYLNIHECTDNNYWGEDSSGVSLTGKKIRHHKIPTRKTLNEPLITKTGNDTTISRYRLEVTISLASGQTYPEVDGNPVPIAFTFNYKINNIPNSFSFNGIITDTDIGVPIVIYDDITIPVFVSGSDYIEIDTNCQLFTDYIDIVTPNFEVDYSNPISYNATIVQNTDVANIIGIKLDNIKKPHPSVIGFWIVRNELTDNDKVVIDNALIGNITKYNQYRAFGHLVPEMLNVDKDDRSVSVFSPVHQFLNKTTEFTNIDLQGYYEQTSKTIGSAVDGGNGVLIEDVQPGTTYNPDINKGGDSDGFDLLIGEVQREMAYKKLDFANLPEMTKVNYINATFNKIENDLIYYNISADNKIAIATFNTPINLNNFLGQSEATGAAYGHPTRPQSIFNDNYKYRLLYGTLTVDNQNAYSNFMDRPYYKEFANPVLFGNSNVMNNIQCFNGDAHIGPMSINSSVYYDTQFGNPKKKSRVWQIVLGAVLIVVGIVASLAGVGIISVGAGLTAIAGAVASMALSYGISQLSSGIKFEQMKSMIEIDYPAGLKNCMEDAQVIRQLSTIRVDDTFKWMAGIVTNIYIESYINIALRSPITNGGSKFFDAPRQFSILSYDSYITDKFTIIDRDQDNGRLYKGYATGEWYDINLDYMRKNKEKIYYHLPLNYDCCNQEEEKYPNRVWYSEQSFQEETTDNYRTFLPNNYKDINGKFGPITDLFVKGNKLYIHTTEGLWELPASYQERVVGDLVSFIGTGSFFSIPPIPVMDADLGSMGSQHKWATIKTPNGVIFLNQIEGTVYLFAQSITPISRLGLYNWFKENLVDNLASQFELLTGISFINKNNPANINGIGIHSIYDSRLGRVLITKKDYLILNPDNFIAVNSLSDIVSTKLNYIINDDIFIAVINDIPTQIQFDNSDYFINKSWTISFNLKDNKYKWLSWHSYIPNFYFNDQTNFYSTIYNSNKFWKHNILGSVQKFYGIHYPHILEYVSLSNPLSVKIYDAIMIQSIVKKWDNNIKNWFEQRNVFFNKLLVYNSRQSTGELTIIPKDNNSQDYLLNQVLNSATQIIASNKENNWNINTLRDYVDDYTQPFLSTKWNDIKLKYFIDKVINTNTINYQKDWYNLESFRDKYLVIRLIFDNFDNVNILTNYNLETEQNSLR